MYNCVNNNTMTLYIVSLCLVGNEREGDRIQYTTIYLPVLISVS